MKHKFAIGTILALVLVLGMTVALMAAGPGPDQGHGAQAGYAGQGAALHGEFLDLDGDEVCDNYATRESAQNSTGNRWGYGQGRQAGNRGAGPNFVDQDGDGVCDSGIAPTAMPDTAIPTEASASAEDIAVATETVADVTKVDESGDTTMEPDALSDSLGEISTGALSAEETQGILYMFEEEKLARDVYLTLYDQWGLPIFQNIANSEATHMDAVNTLIDRYGLEDPATDNDVGVFTDTALQGLYEGLIDEGRQSLTAALQVGAAIEEIDIRDLQEYVAQTDKDDILLVYENLMKGSRNHLRSIVSTLRRQSGESYAPQYLDQPSYDAIINTPSERGRG